MADLKDLLGTWTMLSWKKETIATGEIVDALGPDPVGYITYGADGRMHSIVVRRDRLAPERFRPQIRKSYAFSTACLPIRALTHSMTKRSSTTSMYRGIRLSQRLT